jgi:hypothetical protein
MNSLHKINYFFLIELIIIVNFVYYCTTYSRYFILIELPISVALGVFFLFFVIKDSVKQFSLNKEISFSKYYFILFNIFSLVSLHFAADNIGKSVKLSILNTEKRIEYLSLSGPNGELDKCMNLNKDLIKLRINNSYNSEIYLSYIIDNKLFVDTFKYRFYRFEPYIDTLILNDSGHFMLLFDYKNKNKAKN